MKTFIVRRGFKTTSGVYLRPQSVLRLMPDGKCMIDLVGKKTSKPSCTFFDSIDPEMLNADEFRNDFYNNKLHQVSFYLVAI